MGTNAKERNWTPAVAKADQDARSREPHKPLRVMHVLSVSIPHINGYALRSKYIVETQAESGLVEPCVVTSPFYPGLKGTAEDTEINGVPYYRVASPQDKGGLRDPQLFPFVVLHWAKKLLNGSGVFIRARRRQMRRIFRNGLRIGRREGRRGLRYLVRVWRRLGRVGTATGNLIETIAEPVIGRRFWPAVDLVTRSFVWATWFLTRPFEPAFNFVAPRARRVRSRLINKLRDYLRGDGDPDTPKRVPLRQRSVAYLQAREKSLLLGLFEREILRLCEKVQPDVIHVHSPYFCGVPAVKAGRRAGIPVVYEVRGIWEESGVAQGNFSRDSEQYRMWRREETWAMQNADAVTCICEQLRQDIISRDVDPRRVFVASNAVDASLFVPQSHANASADDAPDSVREVREKLGAITIGYIGSIRPLEGVDGLVRGAAELIHRGHDATLLVVGGGKGILELQDLAAELGIADRAVFTGQVPHDEVQHYYELIDIFVISRPASRVAKLVTPLKPLEAMAMEKALIVSDLPALRELVSDGKTGLVYRAEDPIDLADQCERLIENDDLRERLAKTARDWVVHERSWRHTIGPQLEAYASLVPGFSAPQPAEQRRPAKAA